MDKYEWSIITTIDSLQTVCYLAPVHTGHAYMVYEQSMHKQTPLPGWGMSEPQRALSIDAYADGSHQTSSLPSPSQSSWMYLQGRVMSTERPVYDDCG